MASCSLVGPEKPAPDDEWLKRGHHNYLVLVQNWWQGCPPVGPLEPPGECLFYGDLNQNRCLDLEDYELIRAQQGLTGEAASSCSDLDQSGYIDALDLAYLLGMMDTAGCPTEELDPTNAIPDYDGVAQSCNGANIGDLNDDSVIDQLDLSAVLATLGLAPNDASRCMDVDRNGAVELADALHILHRQEPSMVAVSCQDSLDEFEELVESSKTCSADDECQIVDADCTHLAEHCSRIMYVNQSVELSLFKALARDVSDCIANSGHCSACDEPPAQPACVMGRCQSK